MTKKPIIPFVVEKPDIPTKPVMLITVPKADYQKLVSYFDEKPMGEVKELVKILETLYGAYKNNTAILINMQPEGGEGLSLDDFNNL